MGIGAKVASVHCPAHPIIGQEKILHTCKSFEISWMHNREVMKRATTVPVLVAYPLSCTVILRSGDIT